MSSERPHVDPNDFKGALGSWAAGVTVVTTRVNDMVYGLTVSSFASLSVDPLLILVCIQNSNHLVEMVQQSKSFAVSILAEGQEEISSHFATSGREPVDHYRDFGTIEWHTGSPIIDGAVAHLDCELHDALPGGDHTIMVGRVIGAAYDPNKQPLVYFRRAYRSVGGS
jgi:flavin reductase (DIM6/NTAB) family NADH-FMN oxidoreductase RutF